MKKALFSFSLILFFLFMLIKPEETFHGASEGLLLWFQIVLPTLLPFLIITNLLVSTNTLYYISRSVSWILSPLFHTSPAGTFAVVSGFLCGYPMGAKVTADLLRSGKIKRNEAKYLLSFCNNTSPMFIMNYAVLNSLGKRELLFPSLAILMLAPVLVSFFFRLIYRDTACTMCPARQIPPLEFHFDRFDHTIMNSFETITKVGGYIILFSVLAALLETLPFTTPLWDLLLLPSLEVTNGIAMLARSKASFPVVFILMMALISFGGFCSIAQTQCMIHETGISVLPYIAEKLITATVTSLLSILYIKCIYLR